MVEPKRLPLYLSGSKLGQRDLYGGQAERTKSADEVTIHLSIKATFGCAEFSPIWSFTKLFFAPIIRMIEQETIDLLKSRQSLLFKAFLWSAALAVFAGLITVWLSNGAVDTSFSFIHVPRSMGETAADWTDVRVYLMPADMAGLRPLAMKILFALSSAASFGFLIGLLTKNKLLIYVGLASIVAGPAMMPGLDSFANGPPYIVDVKDGAQFAQDAQINVNARKTRNPQTEQMEVHAALLSYSNYIESQQLYIERAFDQAQALAETVDLADIGGGRMAEQRLATMAGNTNAGGAACTMRGCASVSLTKALGITAVIITIVTVIFGLGTFATAATIRRRVARLKSAIQPSPATSTKPNRQQRRTFGQRV